jgi:hypothetical protein
VRIHVLPVIGDKLVAEVRTKDIIDVIARVRKKVAPRTVYNVYSVVCAFAEDEIHQDRDGEVPAGSPGARVHADRVEGHWMG